MLPVYKEVRDMLIEARSFILAVPIDGEADPAVYERKFKVLGKMNDVLERTKSA